MEDYLNVLIIFCEMNIIKKQKLRRYGKRIFLVRTEFCSYNYRKHSIHGGIIRMNMLTALKNKVNWTNINFLLLFLYSPLKDIFMFLLSAVAANKLPVGITNPIARINISPSRKRRR